MKIIILGAGHIGASLAEHLTHEGNDITIVDIASAQLQDLGNRLDIRTVEGKGSHPSILRHAGAEDADLLLAVTDSDEINIVACQVAHILFHTPTKIARVRDKDFLSREELFAEGNIAVDVLISPEQIVTDHIYQLFKYPGALQVLDFAGGLAKLVAVKALRGGLLVGQEIASLHRNMPNVDTKVAAIYRRGQPLIPRGDTVIEDDDEVFFIAAREHISAVMDELRRAEAGYRRVMIAGGGNIGECLAAQLEDSHQVKIIEVNLNRCNELTEHLDDTVVLHGSATSKRLLDEEKVEDCDVFCALTNDDEDNIMASLLAKRLGARKVLTLINDTAYVDLIHGGDIDIAISPQQATIGCLLTHIRKGDIANVYSLRCGAAEAMEVIVHGDSRSSKLVGRTIADIKLPSGSTIGAIIREEEVLIAHDELVVEDGDHVILFMVNKRRVRDIERLFQAEPTLF